MRSPRGAAAFVIFLASTVAGLYFATQLMIAYPPPIRRPLGEALEINLTYYYLWGLSVPAVVWVARRFRFERGTWVFHFVIHSIWAITLTLAQIVIAEWLLRNFTHARDSMQAKPIAQAVLDNFQSSLPTYFVILFGYYAFDYYVKFRDRELRASQLETRLTQAQLQALKMQLNPHFLFNTLNTISSLMYTDIDAADAMMSRLSELLRLTLEKEGAHEVTLREEMDLLERYLDIERIRFEDRLRVTVDINAEALAGRVPNFSLQPLVENAIRHGIAPRPEGGLLHISAARTNGLLEIRLRDDGPGLRPGATSGPPRREGIGVANTRARLAQLYGDRYRFEMANAPGGGTLVTMVVPYHT
ncbi:MAG TPA: histidine kinase [Thermoanaerobaculia bacterium]|jgi:signal transduction histidine kinase|nr:histidine kinase [Thermoanaerobaculia bacterium]